jgi:hypothetical protein
MLQTEEKQGEARRTERSCCTVNIGRGREGVCIIYGVTLDGRSIATTSFEWQISLNRIPAGALLFAGTDGAWEFTITAQYFHLIWGEMP